MQVTRLTGSYYTSQRIADYMAAWALRDRSDTLLEPAFGDGVFLDAAFNRFSALGNDTPTVIGVEVQPAVSQNMQTPHRRHLPAAAKTSWNALKKLQFQR